jgi:hypothetical protein
MINKQGKLETEILIFLILLLGVSAIIFGLVHFGVISVKPGVEQVSVLNTEFLPMGRGGSLTIPSFQFCGWIDQTYQCLDPRESFRFGEPVRFKFIADSSTYQGAVKIVENYQVVSPSGKIVLEAESKNDFNFELNSKKPLESLSFQDYFVINPGGEVGIYTLNLILYNPLIDKKVTLTKNFEVK